MKSPKFPYKRPDLEKVINESRLKSRWNDKVREFLRRQSVPDPLEHLDFHLRLVENCRSVTYDVCSGAYIPQAPMRLLSEKSKGLCRQIVIPGPRDALVLQALSDALWDVLKSKSPSSNVFYAPQDQPFTESADGHSNDYGMRRVWLKFQKAILKFTENRKYIVVTDIANYYDFISHDHLRNVLADLAETREHALDLLIYILDSMQWQPDYMPKKHVGLPQISLDGTRLLAHCFLFEIDKIFSKKTNYDYARFMDDIDIGADRIIDARHALRDLDLALQTRQVRLNAGKTKILNEIESRRHFQIAQNARVDRLVSLFKSAASNGDTMMPYKRLLSQAIHRGLRNNNFLIGNGEKILKRCINLSRNHRVEIDDNSFYKILTEWPSVRYALLLWWQKSNNPFQKLHLIKEFVSSGYIVDDVTNVNIAVSLVAARIPGILSAELSIEELCQNLNPQNKWSLYARLWILSKYGTTKNVIELIEETASIWAIDQYLSRVVGGLYPIFLNSPLMSIFEKIVRKESEPARAVLEFHVSLTTDPSVFMAVENFLLAINPSMPNQISHSKFLMLVSILKSMTVPTRSIAGLRRAHASALTDPYYAKILETH